jgi:hypothetical protein
MLRTKSGPNGHSLNTSILDLRSLTPKLKSNLEILGGEALTKMLYVNSHSRMQRFLFKYFGPLHGKENVKAYFRKLSYFPDRELKVRVIGVLD